MFQVQVNGNSLNPKLHLCKQCSVTRFFSWQIPYHPCMVYLPSRLIVIANVSKYTIHGCYGNYSSHQSDNMEKPKKVRSKTHLSVFLVPVRSGKWRFIENPTTNPLKMNEQLIIQLYNPYKDVLILCLTDIENKCLWDLMRENACQDRLLGTFNHIWRKYLMCSGNAALNEAAEDPNATGRRSQDVPFPRLFGCWWQEMSQKVTSAMTFKNGYDCIIQEDFMIYWCKFTKRETLLTVSRLYIRTLEQDFEWNLLKILIWDTTTWTLPWKLSNCCGRSAGSYLRSTLSRCLALLPNC